jgi:hypothetical protein
LLGLGLPLSRVGPADAAPRVLLFLDEQSVQSFDAITFHPNPAAKHPENPLLLPGEPHQWDSLQVTWPATVLYSTRDRMFRCWYSGLDVIQAPGRVWKPGYAESADGIHWVKPNLGQVEFLGKPTNQIDGPGRMLSTVFENPFPGAPESERFGSLWLDGKGMESVKVLAFSPDGKVWRRDSVVYGPIKPEKAKWFQDVCQLLYDPSDPDPEFRVKGYAQGYFPVGSASTRRVRQVGLVHGPDARRLRDADPPIALAPEAGIDEELHFSTVSKIGDLHVMLFESDRFGTNPIHGDLKLAVSRDGRRFRRVHPKSPIVATGAKGTWDENLLVTTTSALQRVGDEMRIYYLGCPNVYNSWPVEYAVTPARRGSQFAPCYLGAATLPRDRFAYARGPGLLTTQPWPVAAHETLELDVDGGDVRIEALSATGATVARGRLDERRGRELRGRVLWTDGFSKPAASLRIALGADTKLYSLSVT